MASMRHRFTAGMLALAALAAWDSRAAAAAEEDGAPRFSLPIACEPHKTCFIQSYVDVDPGAGVHDYACGSATYDGHKGIDFRLLSTAEAVQGVAVLAAADGTVKALRDGMEDVLISEATKGSIKDRECGNGLVLDHGQGWETQYCHMRRGSVAVRRGDTISRGQRLGDVGYSGLAEFAHVHFEVRRNGTVIDPFSGRGQDGTCGSHTSDARGLWDEAATKAFPHANGEIIAASFTAQMPVLEALERESPSAVLDRQSEQLIFLVRLTNLRAGDQVRLAVRGPEGFAVDSTSKPLDGNKATYMSYTGKRRTLAPWPGGHYEGRGQLLRGGAVVSEMRAELEIAD
jgi:hypothetical protein